MQEVSTRKSACLHDRLRPVQVANLLLVACCSQEAEGVYPKEHPAGTCFFV